MLIENGIVLYDEFKILTKLAICSLAEYKTIYGQKKKAILHNQLNRIVCNLDDTYYLDNSLKSLQQLSILEEYENKFRNFYPLENIVFESEYAVTNNEFIRNFQYKIKYQTGKLINKYSKNLRNALKAINETTKESRMKTFNHEVIEKDGKELIIYTVDMDTLRNKGSKLVSAKKLYYRETYDILMENYYREKELRKEQKNLRKEQEELRLKELRKQKRLVRLQKKNIIKHTSDSGKTDVKLAYQNTIPTSNIHSEPIIKLQEPSRSEDPLEKYTQGTANVEISKGHKSEIIEDNSNETSKTDKIITKGNLEPEKKLRTFIATSRNLSIVKFLKNLYKEQCQICGEAIEISPGNFLSEVHHIKPLGAHNGPDVVENTIVLCPNHHAMFDRGAITIDTNRQIAIHVNPENPLNNKPILLKHKINKSYIDYHNKNIFLNSTEYRDLTNETLTADSNCQLVDYGKIVTIEDTRTHETFDVRLEDKFNREFMKPIEKVLLQKCLNDVVRFENFQYRILRISNE